MTAEQSSSSAFFGFLKDVVTLGLQRSSERSVPMVLGLALYAAIVALLIFSVVYWGERPIAVVGLIASLLIFAIILLLLTIGPTLRDAVQNVLASTVVIGFLAAGGFLIYVLPEVLFGSNSAGANQTSVRLEGEVVYAGSGPAGGVSVSVQGRPGFSDATDEKGAFSIHVPAEVFRDDTVGLRFTFADTTLIERYARKQFPIVKSLGPRSRVAPDDTPVDSTDAIGADPGGEEERHAAVREVAAELGSRVRSAEDAVHARRFAAALKTGEGALAKVPVEMRSQAAIQPLVQQLRSVVRQARDSLSAVQEMQRDLVVDLGEKMSQASFHAELDRHCEVVEILIDPITRSRAHANRYSDFNADDLVIVNAEELYEEALLDVHRLLQNTGERCAALH